MNIGEIKKQIIIEPIEEPQKIEEPIESIPMQPKKLLPVGR